MTDSREDSVLVELRPFVHQVGGHSVVLELNKSTICKPYIEKEVWFYENEPEVLKQFTPKYLGEINVICDIKQEKKCLLACLPESVAKTEGYISFSPPATGATGTRTMTSSVKGTPAVASCKRGVKRCLSPESDDDSRTSQFCINSENKSGLDLWSIECLERQINKYGFWANNQPQKFIMLENLVHNYKWPCMLDMKMGRRQYGEDSSAEKRKLLESRCAFSTSATLGFRICGSQVFQAETETYITHDKYYGRNLNDIGAAEELMSFFHNGVTLRYDVISCVIRKLKKLKSCLLTQNSFRFFSCSLLLMYDGQVPHSSNDIDGNEGILRDGESVTDVLESSEQELLKSKEIEKGGRFVSDVNSTSIANLEHSTINEPPFRNKGTDTVGTCGESDKVNTALDLLQDDKGSQVSQHVTLHEDNPGANPGSFLEELPNTKLTDMLSKAKVEDMPKFNAKGFGTNKVPKTDVRLIDFAHVSETRIIDENEGTVESTIIFGLDNLISIFEKLLYTSSSH